MSQRITSCLLVVVVAGTMALTSACTIGTGPPGEGQTASSSSYSPGQATAPTTSPGSAPSSSSEPASTSATTIATVPGYAVGQFPPIPLIQIPDLSALDAATSKATVTTNKIIGTYPGVTVAPAHCTADSKEVKTSTGSMRLYGDGSSSYKGSDGYVANYGDGSGSFSLNGVSATVNGDGSGSYKNGSIVINSHGDGSGNYKDETTSVSVFGDGSGKYRGPNGTIKNNGDGSGEYRYKGVVIENFGDGSGSYKDYNISIRNFGDGTAVVDGVTTKAEKIPAVPKMGTFPRMGTLKPAESCGITITLQDSLLFDFGKHDIRSDASATLQSLSRALKDLEAKSVDISGHTDSVGSDDINQTLSENRAKAVSDALKANGVTAAMSTRGYGKTRPVAPNEVDGVDNPAGRQLNRRVEVFIPAT